MVLNTTPLLSTCITYILQHAHKIYPEMTRAFLMQCDNLHWKVGYGFQNCGKMYQAPIYDPTLGDTIVIVRHGSPLIAERLNFQVLHHDIDGTMSDTCQKIT